MKTIKNSNLKQLAEKLKRFKKFENAPRELRDEILNEITFSRLIIPASDVSEDSYIVEYEELFSDYVNLCVFTDLDEFKKRCEKYEPVEFMIWEFENNIYTYIINLKINGAEIPMNYIYDMVSRERYFESRVEEDSHHYSLEDTRNLITNTDNKKLNDYLSERKRIQSYLNLFSIIYKSVMFVEVIVENNCEEVIFADKSNPMFNIKNGFITLYSDLNSIESDYFAVADFHEIIKFTLYNQLKGIKINDKFTLSRKQIFKKLEDIRFDIYRYNYTDALNYIFRRKE